MTRGSRRIVFFVLLILALAQAMGGAQARLDEARRLAGFCQVWGLLKYYHPGVAARAVGDWDQVMTDAVPRFKAAATKREFNKEIVNLVSKAGLAYVYRELSVGIPRQASAVAPHFRWIDDSSLFEPSTAVLLKAVALARSPELSNPAAVRSGSGNPNFSAELPLDSPQYPDEATRLLSLFRFWNMVQYYFPNRDVIDRDWIERLPELVPVFQQASNDVEYHLAVTEMTASINDAHASTSSSVLFAQFGAYSAPLQVRLVEGRTAITRVFPRLLTPGIDLRVGDVVTHVDSVAVEKLRAALRRWTNGSNEASLERNIHNYLVRTSRTQMTLTIQRDDRSVSYTIDCPSVATVYNEPVSPPSQMYAILPGNIGYVHMGLLKREDVEAAMSMLRNTRAIIFDIRNYPNSTLYSLAYYLNETALPFAKFLEPDYTRPGSFHWRGPLTAGPGTTNAWNSQLPSTYRYRGRVVVLVNQETLSQAEYTVMAFQTAPDTTVIGSQTAGADGNVSQIRLPGGIYTYFSGLSVYYPDGRPTQRIGIVPDIEVRPTIRGLSEGRDEVLEAAIAYLR